MTAWTKADRAHERAVVLADRHYSRQKPGTPQFVAPGRCVVLLAELRGGGCALWVSRSAEYVQHEWPGAWMNTLFRNEGAGLSSQLIREAVQITRGCWPVVPARGMVTFVDPSKVRHKRDPGRCYLRAGFRRVGVTPKGLVVLQLLPQDMPEPLSLLEAAA